MTAPRPIPGILDRDAAGDWYLRDLETLLLSRGLRCAFIMGRLQRIEKHWVLTDIGIKSTTNLAIITGVRWCKLAGPYIGPTLEDASRIAAPHMARIRNLFELP